MCFIKTKYCKKIVLEEEMKVKKRVSPFLNDKCYAYFQTFVYIKDSVTPEVNLVFVDGESWATDSKDVRVLDNLGYRRQATLYYDRDEHPVPSIQEGYHFFIGRKREGYENAYFIVPKGATVWIDKVRGLGVASKIMFHSYINE